MADLKDALKLLTDPKYRGGSKDGMARMHASAILGKLQADGTDLDTARALARAAVKELRGDDRSYCRTSPQVGGGPQPRHQWVDDFWVPEDKLRSP